MSNEDPEIGPIYYTGYIHVAKARSATRAPEAQKDSDVAAVDMSIVVQVTCNG